MTAEPESELRSLPVAVGDVVLTATDSVDEQRQKRARIVLDSMYQFLGLLDAEGNVVEINRAALEGAGVELQDVIGRPFWRTRWWAVSEEGREQLRQMIREAGQGRFVHGYFEVFGEEAGRRTIFVDFSLTPIRDRGGQVVFLLPEGRNITEKITIEAQLKRRNGELQSALERLREMEEFRSRFFANVSHELRTPLTLILGPVEQLLREQRGLGERSQTRLETIKRNAAALLDQVNDLLDLAKFESGRMPVAYVSINVPSLVREIASGFLEAARDRDIDFQISCESEFQADVDRAKYGRIVVNILSNAFKFTPRGGRIICAIALLSPNRFLLSVQDNGPGVPDPLKQSVFDRFTRGEEAGGAPGTGLGLNIVKDFVDLHGGTVVVLDAPGGGAIFQVELPVHAPEGRVVRDGGEALPIRAGYVGDTVRLMVPDVRARRADLNRILVVEDNQELRLFLYDVLIDDYDVMLAEDGAAALKLALQDSPDLIITDLMMPLLDGEAFIRALREQPAGATVPIIVISARGDGLQRETLLDNLVQDYVTKPFSAQELRARVRNLMLIRRTMTVLQGALNSQASDIGELTGNLVEARRSLQASLDTLQASERRWKGIYDNTVVGIALTDCEGRVIKANPALQRMLGYPGDEIAGVSLVDITEQSKQAAVRRNVQSLFEGRFDHYHVEKRYEKKGGGFLWADVSVSVIPAVGQEETRAAAIVADITSRKQAENGLEEARAELSRIGRFTAMGELVGSIAHEVNQPLAAVISNCQAALRWMDHDPPELGEVAAAIRRVNRDATLASEVIARIRHFLRAGPVRWDRIPPRRLVDDMLLMLRTALDAADIAAEVDAPDDLPLLVADEVQIKQVILNLMLNAIDAMRGTAGRVRRLAVQLSDGGALGILFSVSDTGPGIRPEAAGRIFEPLFTTKGQGLGLGLAISRTIVENHGGHLWYESGEQGGAVFHFNVPGGADTASP